MTDEEPNENDEHEMDTWMEMNRSLSLFFAITRLLSSTAMVILLASNRDAVYSLLLTTEEKGKKMRDIPLTLSILFIGTLVQLAFTSILGIWGYARLNRHLLVYYGCALLLSLLWAIYWFLIIFYKEREDYNRISTFKDYKYSRKSRAAIDIFQKYYKCCGIANYKFEDVVPLPRSCCRYTPKGQVCMKKNIFKNHCRTKRMDILESLKISGTWTYIPYIAMIFGSSTIFEVFLAYNMVYHVFKQNIEDW